MAIGLTKGIAVKCQSCGHEDAVFYQKLDFVAKLLTESRRSWKCPQCGGKMMRDPDKVIMS
jgi:DNA-directed RNA polymerase subunit RPC12/RpoP